MTESVPAAMREAVAARIMRNIEWADEEGLRSIRYASSNDFYTALRHRL
ncbi:MAG: hypothetical protein O7G83_19020 [Proteobacteria bacterium]|nr:hypothetical protein [Pseudomonadota bacterium]